MNKVMRKKQYSSYKFIFQIFSISVLSSFYNLLCSLNELKNDKFFGKSVIFDSFVIERMIRIFLSILINIINIILICINDTHINEFIIILVFILYF